MKNMKDSMKKDTDAVKEAKLSKAAEKFSDNLKVSRPGFGNAFSHQPKDSEKSKSKVEKQKSVKVSNTRIELSEILWVEVANLKENPFNDYPPLSEEESVELASDIREKGVIVPLIVRMDEDILICGHNRRRASLLAEEKRIPVQRVLRKLTEREEREIMKSENDRRRGGHWSKEKKEEFIKEHFGEEIQKATHGGDRKSDKRNQGSMNLESLNNSELPDQDSMNLEIDKRKIASLNLASEIEKKSRGKITKGTAQRLISNIKKKSPSSVISKKSEISEKDRKRGEKLVLQLSTVRKTRDLLEEKLRKTKEEEKRLLKELKNIGQPELFGIK